MSDSQLLEEFLRTRDREVLEVLIARYEGLVWAVCNRLLNNRCDTEDAFQITFLTLVQKAHRIRKPESLSNWLYGVARKTAIRIRARRAVTRLEEPLGNREIVEDRESVLESITRQHEINLIDQKLESMNEKHRAPLVLHYYCSLTAKQIADQLDLSESAVEGRLRRGRQWLRSELQRDGLRMTPGMLGTLAICLTIPNPDLVAATTERCVTTLASLSAGTTTLTISSGVKTMILKSICLFGISAILALGGYMHLGVAVHSPISKQSVSDLTIDQVPASNQETVNAEVITESNQAVEQEQQQDKEDDSWLRQLHHHLMSHHDRFGAHIHEMLHAFHGVPADDDK